MDLSDQAPRNAPTQAARQHRQALRRIELRARELGLEISEPKRACGSFDIELQHRLRRRYPYTGLGLIYGEMGVFKSTIARALAWTDLNGQPFLGQNTEHAASSLIYVAGEDADRAHEYFSECVERARVNNAPFVETPLIVRGPGLNLRNAESVHRFVKLVKERNEILRTEDEDDRGAEVVFIDTVQSVSGSGFNALQDDHVGDAIRGMKALRDGLGAEWIWGITHAGKDAAAGIKGSSKWYEDPDLILRVVRPEKASGGRFGRLVFEKDRELGREGQSWDFRIDSIESIYAKPGDEPSFRVVCEASAPVTGRMLVDEAKLAGSERKALGVLQRLMADECVRVIPDPDQIETLKAAGCDGDALVPASAWRSAFVALGTGRPDSERRAFRRAADALVKKRAVLEVGDFACATL